MATVRRQEQEPATEDVTEVAPGILRMQLPIMMPGLGHVNCYALEDGRGYAVVDPGLPGPDSYDALLQRLATAELPLSRLHTVIVTHSHPDHFGGAARVREETGADIVTHRDFRLWFDPEPDAEDPETAAADDTPQQVLQGPWSHPVPWGGEPFRPPEGSGGRSPEEFRAYMTRPRPTRRLDDADVASFARRDWIAIHTPGHTPDHLCLFDPAEGVVLSGDHVLPTITPHISGIGNSDDPLAEFFASLDRVQTLEGVKHVLPAHGHPFTNLSGRVDEIKKHHIDRLDRLTTASHDLGRAASVHELMQHLFSPRAWGSMAESETYAHLEHLRLAGQAGAHWQDDLLLYEVTA
jgi:glyoxylase-like metal-dependent hydrolase (beta-lactamase superfamily II)